MAHLPRINPRFSAVRRLDFDALARLMDQGYTMMAWADPFYPDPMMPAHIIEAVKRSLDHGRTHYTAPTGSLELRRTIAAKLQRYNGLTVDPATEVLITPGSDSGLFYAMQVLLEPGDEVLNPEPSYPSNPVNAELLGAVNVWVPLDERNGFQLDLKVLTERITSKSKLVVLTHPNNPTTTVYSRSCLEGLAAIVERHNLFVVADHAFEDVIFDDREFVTFAALPRMFERTISVFSTSKGMGMSGFRVGYNVAPREIMEVMHSAAVNVLGATNTFAQDGAIAAFSRSEFMADFIKVYDGRRRFAVALLNDVLGVHCLMPESGFMIWIDVGALGSGAAVAKHILEHARVIVGAGESYGPSGVGHLRIMLGSLRADEAYREAMNRIASALRSYPTALRSDPGS